MGVSAKTKSYGLNTFGTTDFLFWFFILERSLGICLQYISHFFIKLLFSRSIDESKTTILPLTDYMGNRDQWKNLSAPSIEILRGIRIKSTSSQFCVFDIICPVKNKKKNYNYVITNRNYTKYIIKYITKYKPFITFMR